jgi:hypothetical protein
MAVMRKVKQQANDHVEEVDHSDDYGSYTSMERDTQQSQKKSKKKELHL